LGKTQRIVLMSDKMTPSDFSVLLETIRAEYKENASVFSVPVKAVDAGLSFKNGFMDLEMPFGPAAGPHTQLAQNIAAAYAAGARFIELKTVQIIAGEQLHINKPCIAGKDEFYNIEWSTELSLEQAFAEYVKAYFLLKFMAGEFGNRLDGFSFNMSVGYDLAGIKSEPVDRFIEQMKNAEQTEIYKACHAYLAEHIEDYERFSAVDLKAIGSQIADSITVSTMHGCPAAEIEKIAEHLILTKKIPVYIKLNPTLNTLQQTKELLENKGYGYVELIEQHFVEDLQMGAAVPLLERLLAKANEAHVFLGVKLTNTLPVAVMQGELEDQQMYLSGKPLFLLSLSVAQKLVSHFGSALPVSFSGGLDSHNLKAMLDAGIYPLTMATALLKGKGYGVLGDYTRIFEKTDFVEQRPCRDKVNDLLKKTLEDEYYQKKQVVTPKVKESLPLLNCKNCRLCINVCPNRANVMLDAGAKKQVVHIDAYCNSCGNCATFCPYEGRPYTDKFTLFASGEAYENSDNPGIVKKGKTFEIRQLEEYEGLLQEDYKNLVQILQDKFDLNR